MMMKASSTLLLLLLPTLSVAFVPVSSARANTAIFSTVADLEDLKAALVAKCKLTPKTSLMDIRDAVDQVEALAEQVRVLQCRTVCMYVSVAWCSISMAGNQSTY
jgi:hypothetical protein